MSQSFTVSAVVPGAPTIGAATAVETTASTNSPAASTNISTAPASGVSTVGAAQPNGGNRVIQFRTNISF